MADFCKPPYQCQLKYHLYNDVEPCHSRLLSANESERSHWIDVNYSVYARKTGSHQQFETDRQKLVGNSWHIGVVCALSHQSLCLLEAIKTPFDWADIRSFKTLEVPGTIEPFTSRALDVCREERQLVMSFMRASEKGQTDVRLDVGTLFRPHAWPRGAIKTRF